MLIQSAFITCVLGNYASANAGEDKICGPPKDSDICLEDETNGEWKGWKCSDASSYCHDS